MITPDTDNHIEYILTTRLYAPILILITPTKDIYKKNWFLRTTHFNEDLFSRSKKKISHLLQKKIIPFLITYFFKIIFYHVHEGIY